MNRMIARRATAVKAPEGPQPLAALVFRIVLEMEMRNA
jgi:hypothetical protein